MTKIKNTAIGLIHEEETLIIHVETRSNNTNYNIVFLIRLQLANRHFENRLNFERTDGLVCEVILPSRQQNLFSDFDNMLVVNSVRIS